MNRTFNKSETARILREITKTLKETENYMEDLKELCTKAEGVAGEVPGYVARVPIGGTTSALKGKLEKSGTDTDILLKKLENAGEHATKLIPAADKSLGEQTGNLTRQIKQAEQALRRLGEFMADTPLTADYDSFASGLEVTRMDCAGKLGDMQAALDGVLAGIKGARKICMQFSKDPVNLSSGNFILARTDMEIPGRHPFPFSRFYNAVNKRQGSLGRDWNHCYELTVEQKGRECTVLLEDGREERHYRTETGKLAAAGQADGTLEETEGGFAYRKRDGQTLRFGPDGRLAAVMYPDGTETTCTYAEHACAGGTRKLLEKIGRPTGECYTLDYDGEGFLKSVTDHTGRKTCYRVEDGCLVEATDLNGGSHRYGYTPGGKLETVENPCGTRTVENTYDGKDRVTAQRFPDGGEMHYGYDDENRTVTLTERNGHGTAYAHDGHYRDIKHTDDEGEERFEYDRCNRKTLMVDKLGNKTRFFYDPHGNLAKTINALGVKTEIRYDERDRITSVRVDGKEKMRNRYDEAGFLTETTDALGNTTHFLYDGKGRPSVVTKPDGSTIRLTHDARGNITGITDSAGGKSTYTYDALNRVAGTVDGNGNRTEYAYDMAGNLTVVRNALGLERLYEYNGNGRVTKITDFDGGVTKREYNALGKVAKITDPQGRETLISYDAMWNPARITAPDGAKTTCIHDGHNRPARIKNADGSQVRRRYDACGRKISETDETGAETTYAYDPLGRLVRVTDPDGAETSYEYDAEGNPVKVTDALGRSVETEYDAAGNPVRETAWDGRSREYTYTALGDVESITDESGLVTRYTYHPGGRLAGTTYPDGNGETYGYDANGNLTERRLPTGVAVTYAYDCLDRLVEVRENGVRKRSYRYDAAGNATAVTDALGNTTEYEYSPAGELTKATDPLGNETGYGYDPCGRLVEIRQYGRPEADGARGECRVTTLVRDIMGRVTEAVFPDGEAERYTYTLRGELSTKTDRDGFLTEYGYDANGSLGLIRYGDGREVRLSHNPLRQLEEMRDWLGTTRVETGDAGLSGKTTAPDGTETLYRCNTHGQRTAVRYPDGTEARYAYDGLMRLEKLTIADITGRVESIGYEYDAAGFLSRKVLPGGMETLYRHDGMGRLTRLTHRDGAGTLDSYTHSYDGNGNLVETVRERRGLGEESGTYRYAYDAAGRLTGVEKDGAMLRSYGYDAFGNRTAMTEPGRETAYAYDAANRLTRRTERLTGTQASGAGTAEEYTYAYDRRGNLTGIRKNGEILHGFRYGAAGRLEWAADGKGNTAVYEYNGLGLRVARTEGRAGTEAPGRETRYTMDMAGGWNSLLQETEGGHTRNYFWDGGAAAYAGGTEGIHYYLRDGLGSPVRTADGEGNITGTLGYDEFGRSLYAPADGGPCQPFGYTGYLTDGITGTYSSQAREYDPCTGRFCAQDAIAGMPDQPATLNRYTYCFNSPLVFVDRDGCWPEVNQPLVRMGMLKFLQDESARTKVKEIYNLTSRNIKSVYADVSKTANMAVNDVKKWINQNVSIISVYENKKYISINPTGEYEIESASGGQSKLIDITFKNGIFSSIDLNLKGKIGGYNIGESIGVSNEGIHGLTNIDWKDGMGNVHSIKFDAHSLGAGLEWGRGNDALLSGNGFRIDLNPLKQWNFYIFDDAVYNSGTVHSEKGIYVDSALIELLAISLGIVCVTTFEIAPGLAGVSASVGVMGASLAAILGIKNVEGQNCDGGNA